MKKRTVAALLVLTLILMGCLNIEQNRGPLPEQQQDTLGTGQTATPEEPPPITVNEKKTQEIPSQGQDEEQNIGKVAVITSSPTKDNEENTQKQQTCSRVFSPQFNAQPYYTGPLFDAHFHLPNTFDEPDNGWRQPVLGEEVTLEQISCFFDKEHVIGTIAFFLWEYEHLDRSLQIAADIKKQWSKEFYLFLIPSELEADELDQKITSYPGVFDGFGEIVFYDPERPGATPDDKISLEINDVAEKHKFIVMFHPDDGQRRKVENAIQHNPNVRFLIHGHESAEYISELMGKYPNVYFSLDSATLYPIKGVFIYGPKERFVSQFRKDFNTLLNSAVITWKGPIEQYPDRFIWGTDRAADWHFDEETSMLFEEFARAFIGKLPPDVQEKYAYKNAEKLLEK
ncbi:amidohydrolase family protein [Candidatus Woesearchaeota archaeon]|nr:amidohydrolase family protein [Candidatus Woesearchaeota archaeon]